MLQSLELMILGMGSVFLFLSLLVACVKGLSHLVIRTQSTASRVDSQSKTGSASTPAASAPMDDPELLSVITTVLHQYREQQSSQKNKP